MKVLILTSSNYEEFIYKSIEPYYSSGHLFLMRNEPDNDVSNWDEISGIGYDIGISFMYQHKVPAEQVNSHTWINFHPGPLPEYKGRNLCYHAIMNGEKEFGATVHYMDENFDTGDIIDVQKFVILPYYTAKDVSDIVIEMSKIQFEMFFPRILAGEQFERKPNIGGTYYRKAIIADVVSLDKDVPLSRFIRAVYYPPHYPKIEIGGVTYKIVKGE